MTQRNVVDGFVYECKGCGERYFWRGRPESCCGENNFLKMTYEKAIGLE